jgi:hypothetical protein
MLGNIKRKLSEYQAQKLSLWYEDWLDEQIS